MGGTETFYMDDMYFSGAPAPVNTAPVFADATVVVDVDENETAVYVARRLMRKTRLATHLAVTMRLRLR